MQINDVFLAKISDAFSQDDREVHAIRLVVSLGQDEFAQHSVVTIETLIDTAPGSENMDSIRTRAYEACVACLRQIQPLADAEPLSMLKKRRKLDIDYETVAAEALKGVFDNPS